MKISIITVSFNSAKTIEDTIKSVINQTYSTIEYIIIDGASTDETLEICNRYKNNINYFISEKDNGIYDAMNKGIVVATGDFIGILNSDDFYVDNKVISDVVDCLKLNNALGIYADLKYVDSSNVKKIKRFWQSGYFSRKKFRNGWMPPHPTVFLKRELYSKFGFFNLALKSAADYELMLRIFYKHEITPCYLSRVIIHMRIGGESNASVKNRLKANKEDRLAWEINGLKPHFFTLYMKPLRKIPQFFKKR